MKKKTIKDPFGFNKAINYDKLNDPKILKTLEEIFKDKPTHNECADCGETIKHDQWSKDNFTLCIDCG